MTEILAEHDLQVDGGDRQALNPVDDDGHVGAGEHDVRFGDRRAAPSGAMLAVCSLCGGAGASTLAYLTGTWVAGQSDAPVLVCDAGEPTGGLSAYAGIESLRTLGELARDLTGDAPASEGIFAEARPGLRLIAAAPRAADEDVSPTAVTKLLGDAREEHPLTVIDCGVLASSIGRLARRAATHVAWLLPATVSGVVRARRVLDAQEPSDADQREIVIARFDAGGRQPPMADLTALADSRRAPLVLMPHVPDLGEHSCDEALDAAQVTLEAISSLVRR